MTLDSVKDTNLMFYESRLLWRIPGALVHLASVKARESGVDQKTRRDDYFRTPIGLPEPLPVGTGTFQEELPRQ